MIQVTLSPSIPKKNQPKGEPVTIQTRGRKLGTSKRLGRWPELFVFIASVLVTLLFRIALPAEFDIGEGTDYTGYYKPVARHLVRGYGLTDSNGNPYAYYPPGFSFLLAGSFEVARVLHVPEDHILSAVTLGCVGVASVLLFTFAKSLWGATPALVSAIIWMTYPPLLWLTKHPNSEIPFLVFFYLAWVSFWKLMRQERRLLPVFFSGVLLGLAMLIRPIAIGAGFAMSFAYYLLAKEIRPRSRILVVTMLLAGNLVMVLPWELWVYSKTAKIIPLSLNGIPSLIDGLTFAVDHDNSRTIEVDRDVKELMDSIHLAASKTMAMSLRDIATLLIDEFVARPVTVAKLFALKFIRAWYATDSGRFEMPLLVVQAIYISLIVSGSLIAWRLGGAARDAVVFAWVIALYFWTMTIIGLSIARYMVPAMGLLFTLIPGCFFNKRLRTLN